MIQVVLQMGTGCIGGGNYELKNIQVGTLNYSGILTSPYEFFTSENEEENLFSQTFAQVVSKIYPDFLSKDTKFNWQMKSIDSNWKSRYAPINIVDAGVNLKTNKMMTKEQFTKTWQEYEQKTKDALRVDYFEKKHQKKEEIQKQMDIQMKRCKEFDHFCYQTMLKIYCGVDLNNMKNDVDAKQYLKKRKERFNKPYLNEQLKMKKTIQFLTAKSANVDVMYFQETNKKLVENFKQDEKFPFHVRTNSESKSIILIHKDFLKIKETNLNEDNQYFYSEYSKRLFQNKKIQLSAKDIESTLNFNNDSAVQFIKQKKILFINVHLNSKQEKNQVQLQKLKKEYSQIVELFEQINIVLGGDFNTTIYKQFFDNNKKNTQVTPSEKESFSVKKKRTYMQPQRKKANALDLAAKDFLISTLVTIQGGVTSVDGKKLQKLQNLPFLPNQNHPYDHFIVKCSFKYPLPNK